MTEVDLRLRTGDATAYDPRDSNQHCAQQQNGSRFGNTGVRNVRTTGISSVRSARASRLVDEMGRSSLELEEVWVAGRAEEANQGGILHVITSCQDDLVVKDIDH